MRDPARIRRITRKLELLWSQYPDQRLGQLLNNYLYADEQRLWLQEDDKTEGDLDARLSALNLVYTEEKPTEEYPPASSEEQEELDAWLDNQCDCESCRPGLYEETPPFANSLTVEPEVDQVGLAISAGLARAPMAKTQMKWKDGQAPFDCIFCRDRAGGPCRDDSYVKYSAQADVLQCTCCMELGLTSETKKFKHKHSWIKK